MSFDGRSKKMQKKRYRKYLDWPYLPAIVALFYCCFNVSAQFMSALKNEEIGGIFAHFYMAGYAIAYIPLALLIQFLIAVFLRESPKFLHCSILLLLAVFLVSSPLSEVFYIG